MDVDPKLIELIEGIISTFTAVVDKLLSAWFATELQLILPEVSLVKANPEVPLTVAGQKTE